MNKGFKRFLSLVLSLVMVFSSLVFVNITAVSAAESYITEEGGWLESAYAEWSSVPNATGFAAYIKGASESDSSYVRLDNELIRKYPTYFRADAVGLKAGQYVMKIVPYVNNEMDESLAFTTGTLTVEAHDRSGSAFSSKSPFYGKGVGAYNNDGTLKSNAKVFYVTKETAKTITADVITDNKGKTTSCTGMQAIIDAKQKGYDTTPYAFRIIGTIEKSDMDSLSSSAEGLQVKGKNEGAELNITIEGIGEDAGIRGFGILCRNAGNVELRNFAIMLCMDDSVSIDTDNNTLWIHNLDLFYGSTGGDSDQAKGDGTVDVKGKSTYITVAYNHFWDSGKSSLCGMGSEVTSSHITYHHNWFDHSDSRHPRIRVQSVHIYNNYYDGNSKYGVGVTLGSSAFVESNYFRNCKHPMMSSEQGSDIMENDKTGVADFSGSGTFSGEAGGVIKAYNNHIEGSDADKFNGGVEPVYYNASATQTNGAATQYDAYLATSRTETVPSSVKALSGGSSYNNFDTDTANFDLGVSEANITPVEEVPTVVTKYAGRVNGGDFKNSSAYTIANSDTSYDVDTVLKAAITNYTSSLVSVGGTETGGTVDTTVSTSTTEATTSNVTEATTEATTSAVDTTTEATTVGTPVEMGEAVTGFTPDTDSGSGISVVYNSSANAWVLNDSSTTAAAEIKLPFAEQTSGKVYISGTATPSTIASKWAFLQVWGTKADGTTGEIFAFGGGDPKGDLSVRVNAGNYTKIGTLTVKEIPYSMVIDLDAKTVEYTIDGISDTIATDVTAISYVYSTTSKSGERNVTVSVPYVAVLGAAPSPTPTEATTTVETTTEATTAVTTEVTTSDASTEATTEAPTPGPSPSKVYGDVDGNGKLEIKDVDDLLNMVLKGNVEVVDGITDVTNDKVVNTADVATILQKLLNGNYMMPCEPNEEITTEATTSIATETTTIASSPTEATTVEATTTEETTSIVGPTTTEATTEETTEATTIEATTEATTTAASSLDTLLNASVEWPVGTYTAGQDMGNGLTAIAAFAPVTDVAKNFIASDGTEYVYSKANDENNCIAAASNGDALSFTAPSNGVVKIAFKLNSGKNGTVFGESFASQTASTYYYREYNVVAGQTYTAGLSASKIRVFYLGFTPEGSEPTTTEVTTIVGPTTTEATTVEATTEATTVEPTEATTIAGPTTTEATTIEVTTEATTAEATTEATTVEPTEATTVAEPTTIEITTAEDITEATTVEAVDTYYDFNDSPVITKDGTDGITYTVSTKTGEVADGLACEAVISNNSLFLNDVSATDTVKATLPLTEKTSGSVTYTAKITPSVNKGNWTIMQLNGVKADDTEGEVLGVRVNKEKFYGLRVNAGTDVTATTVAIAANTTVTIAVTVDFDNDTATLSVNGGTPVQVTGVDAKSITSMSFQTASDARTLYVDDAGITTGTVIPGTEATTEGTTSNETATEGTTSAPTPAPTGSSWTAGSTIPSWLVLSGTEQPNSSSYTVFSTVNGSNFSNNILVDSKNTFAVTTSGAGKIVVYAAANNNADGKGNLVATDASGATIGTYAMPGRKNSAATAFELTVSEATTVTFALGYDALVYKVEIQ